MGETQNLGLLDTRAAVEWLHANVRVFGGDPRKITLGGESVGAGMRIPSSILREEENGGLTRAREG